LTNSVYASSLAKHDVKWREVLDRLRTYKLKLQPKNANFFAKRWDTWATKLRRPGCGRTLKR